MPTANENPVPELWVSLAAACAITRRQDSTIKNWIATKQLGPTEAKQLETRQGPGRAWSIWLPALYAVHTAHGGYYWQPDALQAGNVPLAVAEELGRLRADNARLAREADALRQQLEALHQVLARRGGGGGGASGGSAASGGAGSVLAAQGGERGQPVGAERPDGPAGRVWAHLPPLPGHLVPLSTIGARHGFDASRSSVYRNRTGFAGYIERGPWVSEQGREVVNALDQTGLAAFGRLFGPHKYFHPCRDASCVVCQAAGYGPGARRDGHDEQATQPVLAAVQLAPVQRAQQVERDGGDA